MAQEVQRERLRREGLIDAARMLGFDYVDGNLEFRSIPRVHGERLRELCFPDDIKDQEKRTAATAEAKRLFRNKDWFAAQSMFYDLRMHHFEMKTLAGLRYDLGELVKFGKCDKLGVKSAAMEAAFKKSMMFGKDYVMYFEKLPTPEEQAAWDLDLFCSCYFLKDDSSEPDPSITPDPMVLLDLDRDLIADLENMVAEVQGLHIARGLDSQHRHMVVIGWDAEDVSDWADSVTEKSMNQTMMNRVTKWDNAMKIHHEYLAKTAEEIQAVYRSTEMEPRDMRLDDVVGSFVVKCPLIATLSPIYGHVFSLDIQDHPGREGDDGLLTARMEFGMMEGTMLLSFSKKTLKMTSKSTVCDGSDDEKCEISDLEDVEDYDLSVLPKTKRREQTAPESTAPNEFKKRRSSRSGGEKAPRVKRTKVNQRQIMNGRRRLWFIWRSMFPLEGRRWENHGYLDFNETCTGFRGITWSQEPGEDRELCKFEGFKVETKALRRLEGVGRPRRARARARTGTGNGDGDSESSDSEAEKEDETAGSGTDVEADENGEYGDMSEHVCPVM